MGTNESNLKFSNEEEIISGQSYWLHVEPLTKEFVGDQTSAVGIIGNEFKSTDISKFLEDYMNPKVVDKLPGQSPVTDFMEFSKDYIDSNEENKQDSRRM